MHFTRKSRPVSGPLHHPGAGTLLPAILLVILCACTNLQPVPNPAYPSPLASATGGPRSTPSGAPLAAAEPTPAPTSQLRTPTSPPATREPSPTPPPSQTPSPTITPTSTQPFSATFSIGKSSGGWPVEVYRFGNGPLRLAFVGGIHGGYEWNTILLAYQAVDYFSSHPEAVPADVTLLIIPAANPDGQVKVVGHTGRFSAKEVAGDTIPGRLNAQGVDLNRNWDCKWVPVGYWGSAKVSAGKKPFSEVETQILRDFLTQPPVSGAVFWHSAAAAIYPGGCEASYAPSEALAEIYAKGAGYKIDLSFSGYPVTGTEIDWLSAQSIPAIEVELSTHQSIDWNQNLEGMTLALANIQSLQSQK